MSEECLYNFIRVPCEVGEGHLLLREEMDVILEAVSGLLWDKNPEISSDLARQTYSILKELSPNITSSSFKKLPPDLKLSLHLECDTAL